MLKGKAKQDFIKWAIDNKHCKNPHVEYWYNITLDKGHLSSLIIEWLDTVGIFIHLKRFTHMLVFEEWCFIITDERGMHLNNHVSKESRIENDSRQAILISAIKKANEIYNSRP